MARTIYDFSTLTREQIKTLVEGNRPTIGKDGAIYTGAVRLAFPDLAKAGRFGKFGAVFLFPHANISVLTAKLEADTRAAYPGYTSLKSVIGPQSANPPFRDQGEKVSPEDGGTNEAGKPSYAGYIPGLPYISARSGNEVTAFDIHGRTIDQADIGSMLLPGYWVTGKLNLYKAAERTKDGTPVKPGMFWGLNGIRLLAKDKPFAGGASASSDDFGGAVVIDDPNGFDGDVAGDDENNENFW